jgi:hypothetical protein
VVNITITGTNDAPVVNANNGPLSFTENQAATAIDTALWVAGPPWVVVNLDCGAVVALWRPNGRTPELLDFGECGAMVFICADRTNLLGKPRQNLATVSASTASYSAWVPTNFTNAICRRKPNATISR